MTDFKETKRIDLSSTTAQDVDMRKYTGQVQAREEEQKRVEHLNQLTENEYNKTVDYINRKKETGGQIVKDDPLFPLLKGIELDGTPEQYDKILEQARQKADSTKQEMVEGGYTKEYLQQVRAEAKPFGDSAEETAKKIASVPVDIAQYGGRLLADASQFAGRSVLNVGIGAHNVFTGDDSDWDYISREEFVKGYDNDFFRTILDDEFFEGNVLHENKQFAADISSAAGYEVDRNGLGITIAGAGLLASDFVGGSLFKQSSRATTKQVAKTLKSQGKVLTNSEYLKLRDDIRDTFKNVKDVSKRKEEVLNIYKSHTKDLDVQIPDEQVINMLQDNATLYKWTKDKVGAATDPLLGRGTAVNNFKERTMNKFLNSQKATQIREAIQHSYAPVTRFLESHGIATKDARLWENKLTTKQSRTQHAVEGLIKQNDDFIKEMDKYAERFGTDKHLFREQVDEYAQVIHAPERNAVLGDGAAGMTNKEAAERLAKLERLPYTRELKQSAKYLQDLSNNSLDVLKAGDLISAETYIELRKKYKNHVPLNRVLDEFDDFGDLDWQFGGTSKIKAKDVKTGGIDVAKGSTRQVANIFASATTRLESSLNLARRNQDLLDFVNIMRNNKEQFKGSVKEFSSKAAFDKALKTDKTLTRNMAVGFREGGVQKYLAFTGTGRVGTGAFFKGKQITEGEWIANALAGRNMKDMSNWIRHVGNFTKLLAGLNTRFNPSFLLPNWVRDQQESLINAISDDGVKAALQQKKYVADSVRAIKTAKFGKFGKLKAGSKEAEYVKYYKELEEQGGLMGGFTTMTKKDMEDLYFASDNLNKSLNAGQTRKLFDKVIKFVDDSNAIAEDATRLAAYVQARKAGVSKIESATKARNSTVDFAKRGTMTRHMGSFYMFANAAIQGNYRTTKALMNPKALGAALALTGGMSTSADLNNAAHDINWKDHFNDWELNSNWIYITGIDKETGKLDYIKIPTAYSLRPLKAVIEGTSDVQTGRRNVGEAIKDSLTAVIDTYNVTGSGGSFAQALAPSFAKPGVAVLEDTAWHGGKIDPYGTDETVGYKKIKEEIQGKDVPITKSFMASISEGLYNATGGGIDLGVEGMNYVFESYTGGAGKFVGNSISAIEVGLDSEKEIDINKKPMIRRFIGQKDLTNTKYKVTQEKMKRVKNMVKKEKDPFEQRVMIQEYIKTLPDTDTRRSFLYQLGQTDATLRPVTKGIKSTETPREPDFYEGTYMDWFNYFMAPGKGYSREDAMYQAQLRTNTDYVPEMLEQFTKKKEKED